MITLWHFQCYLTVSYADRAGEKSPTGEAFDVFIGPVVRDLLKLWEGVPAVDMSEEEGMRNFILRCILIWTVHDFLAFGLVSGQQVKGYKGCPICMEDTGAEHSGCLYKMIYMGHRRYMSQDHRWRHARRAFNRQQELRPAPRRQTGEEILEKAMERLHFLQDQGVHMENENHRGDPVKLHGVKRRSVLFNLPYWHVSIGSDGCMADFLYLGGH
jgi:hypothetical protein